MFLAPLVMYLGYQIDAQGLYLVAKKVKAVQDGPVPQNITDRTWTFVLLLHQSLYSVCHPSTSS